MPTVNFIITEEQRTKLHEIAHLTGKSASFVIRRAIDRLPDPAELLAQREELLDDDTTNQ